LVIGHSQIVLVERISIICFGASYAVAFAAELWRWMRGGELARWAAVAFGAAGLFAHSVFLALRLPSLGNEYGSLLFLAWILAVFYLFGSIHHARQVWSIFVLPVVLGLIALAGVLAWTSGPATPGTYLAVDQREFWRLLHVGVFVLAAVGISVAFVASVMYLVQAHRLKTKALNPRFRMLSLERLETMNRRALALAFPFLTVGLVIGTARMLEGENQLRGWTDLRTLSTIALWLLFGILLVLRYGLQFRGRRVALVTIVAFALLLVSLVASHGQTAGGAP
jgi:ABC-type transport system involved in cytochrome c biogenesis permease subunit